MKPIDLVATLISIVLQIVLAIALLWAGNQPSFEKLLVDGAAIGQAVDEPYRTLLLDYRHLLSMARGIFIDGGVVLLCSAALQTFVVIRQVSKGISRAIPKTSRP